MHLLLLLACSESPSWSRATPIETLEDGIGGPKAMARPGDYLLENDRVRFTVLRARYSLGPSPYGGTIADADLQRPHPKYAGGHGNDRLAEMFSTVNMNLGAVDEAPEVSIVNDGADGNAAIIRTDAAAEPFLTMLDPLWAVVGQPEFRITTDYILEPGAGALKIRTTATFGSDETIEGTLLPGSEAGLDVLELAISSGVAFGDFYLQGGSVDVFAPGMGFDEDRAVDEVRNAGVNTFQDPFQFEFVAGVADGVSYGIAAATGDLYVPLFTSSQTAAFGAGIAGVAGENDRFPAGTAYSYERYLAIGKGDVGSVLDVLLEAKGQPYGEVRGYVLEEGTGIALSGLSVLAYQAGAEQPYNQWLSDVGDDTQIDGSFGGRLPPGDYELVVHGRGRPDGVRIPVTVTEGGTVNLVVASPRAGQVSVEVVDELGRAAPSKISFFGESTLNPDLGDPYIAGAPSEVVFTRDGRADVILPPGTYTAIASRGLEYELGTSEPFTVTDTGVSRLRLQVVRSVDTSGYVSADFHVHSVNSFDSGTSLSDRVITMAAEGVEFFTSTDHDALTDYAPTVEDLGLEPWLKTAVGLETTTLEVGHFLGFPFVADTLADQGGAFDWTGMTAGEILDTLDELGTASGYEPVRFVAHPRDGILGYFDQFGYDPYTGTIATPTLSIVNPLLRVDEFEDTFEALELLNGKRFEIVRTPTQPELDRYADGEALSSYDMVARSGQEQEDLSDGIYRLGYGHEGQVDDWFSLLNTGKRYTALGNSDTHGSFSVEAGCPRNYVVAETDEPALLDEQAMADAVRAGHVVASYGPFIRFTANETAIVGDEIVDTDGTVDLHIEVQAPSWIPVDRVELYQNGTLIHEWEGLDPDIYKLVQDLTVDVTVDSWFVVIALGDGDLAPLFTPVEMAPVQLQDVVTEALSDVPSVGSLLSPAIPIPRSGPVLPYALTNPIYVDVDGSGWTAPGLPPWLLPPVDPAEEEPGR
ncbi:MAG: CehA/McbA family metallohydrolase [Pseudomonadota bacterium]|nr:CehA/McbA family metallohydrolase [Pseudomonadota bacterium]